MNLHHPTLATLSAIAALAALALNPGFAQTVRSDFNASAEGWTHTGAAAFQQQAAGGNPGGFLYIDPAELDVTFIYAPAKFLGNLLAFNGGSVSFDGNMLGIGGSPYSAPGFDYGHLRLSSGIASATLDLLPSPGQPGQNQWTTYSAPLTAGAWGKSEAEWLALLGNVTEVRLSVEAMFGAEVQGIDNFTVTAVPEPATYGMLALGLAVVGWARQRRAADKHCCTGRSAR